MFSSYLLDAAKVFSTCDTESNFSFNFVRTNLALALVGKSNATMGSELSPDRLFSREVQAVKFETADDLIRIDEREPIGLPADELQAYVNWLLTQKDGEDRPIHALLCSRSGTFYRKVSSLSKVSELLASMNAKPVPSAAQVTLSRPREQLGAEKRIVQSLPRPVSAGTRPSPSGRRR